MSTENSSWPKILDSLLDGKSLSNLESKKLMQGWLSEEFEPVQTGAFLAAFRSKGLTGEELAAMAEVLREACHLPCSIPKLPMVDTCGTGGDGANTFNISTAVAFTAASCGACVAKHGNRSASGKVGSADVLESLDINLKAPLDLVVDAVSKVNVTFLFAPAWHSSLINLAPLRKKLGVRTVFNLLGPLVNPLRPVSQVLGVANQQLLDPMAEALNSLGLNRGIVVYGAGGLDEASLQGNNEIRLIENGSIKNLYIDSAKYGISNSSIEELQGGDLITNKAILSSVLKGDGTKPQTNVVALNTSLSLWAAGITDDFSEGVDIAKDSLNKGLPWNKLQELKSFLQTNNG